MMRMMNLEISKFSNKKQRREKVRLYWISPILARSPSVAEPVRLEEPGKVIDQSGTEIMSRLRDGSVRLCAESVGCFFPRAAVRLRV